MAKIFYNMMPFFAQIITGDFDLFIITMYHYGNNKVAIPSFVIDSNDHPMFVAPSKQGNNIPITKIAYIISKVFEQTEY